MRVKAFSLMELIVVILLLGIMFSLALTSFDSKNKKIKIPTIQDIPSYMQKLGLKEKATFIVYGDKCENEAMFSNEDINNSNINLPFDKSFIVYKMNDLGIIKEFDFKSLTLENKEQHICFKLDLKKGKFSDKFILKTFNKYLLFLPFFQKVKTFDSLSDAKENYQQNDLYPKSIDDYYQK